MTTEDSANPVPDTNDAPGAAPMRVDGAFGRGTLSPDGNVLSLDFPQSDASQPSAAPMRVTPEDIEAEIASAHYFTAAEGVDMADPEMTDAAMPAPLKLHTFCVLVLRNGHTLAGESCCIDPRMFNAMKGREIALADAKAKLWPLLGYMLRDKIHRREQCHAKYGISERQLEPGEPSPLRIDKLSGGHVARVQAKDGDARPGDDDGVWCSDQHRWMTRAEYVALHAPKP